VTDRRLLFSLLLVPACGPSVSVEDDPTKPDGGDPEKFESSCRSFYASYLTCYEGYGYASSGGGYETVSYDPDEYVESICQMFEQYAAEYGTACIGAMEEVFACVSSLDCEEVFSDDSDGAGYVPEPCRAVFEDASERCPELIPQCGSYGVGGFEGCQVEVSACLDDNTYGVDCEAGGATVMCACEVNGEVTREVSVGGEFSCGEEAWADELEGACGFPAGTL